MLACQFQGRAKAVAWPVEHDDRVDARGHALLWPDEQAGRGQAEPGEHDQQGNQDVPSAGAGLAWSVVPVYVSNLVAAASGGASWSRRDMAATGRGHEMASSGSSKAIDTSSAGS